MIVVAQTNHCIMKNYSMNGGYTLFILCLVLFLQFMCMLSKVGR